MIAQTPTHCYICTGISTAFLCDATESANRKLVRLFARDDIAIYNSIPTAEGALMLAMEQTDVTIHGSQVMVLGFGRVGMTLARLFSTVGAHVRVCVRKAADIARISEMGLHPVLIKDLEQEIANTEVCINTIPHQIVDSKIISAMKKSSLIIDLASSPGGTDFTFADQQGIKNIHALGLPGKVAPKTAGNIIADIFTKVIRSEERRVGKGGRSGRSTDLSSRRRHTRWPRDWSSDVCSSDLKIISAMKKSSLIIDLASSPGGTDFTFADQQGIKNIHALGLPGKVAPKTAGNIIADIFTKVISE